MATLIASTNAVLSLQTSRVVTSHSRTCVCPTCVQKTLVLSSVHSSSCKCTKCTVPKSTVLASSSHGALCKCDMCPKDVHGWSGSSMWVSLNGRGNGNRNGKANKIGAVYGTGRRRSSGIVVKAQRSPAALLDVSELDREKFEGMPYRRSVFTFDDWKRHKSSGRHARHIQTIVSSRVITSLGPPVAAMVGIAISICALNTLVGQGALPEWFPLIHVNPLPFSLTSPALSFLLVFRTNASYGRFDEARKMWGLMLNRTRDVCRQGLTYMARGEFEHERPKLLQFIRHLQSFNIAYKHHMVQEGDLEYDLKTLTSLTKEEIKGVLSATHRPNYVLQVCSEIIGRCHFDSVQKLSMDNNLQTFADDVGGSERIFKTPIPLSYTRLTSRFLVLWHIFLPLALWDSCGWLTVPITAMITAILFCVEEVGVLIEEPFSILALSAISGSARGNSQELLDLHESIKALVVPNIGEEITVPETVAQNTSNGNGASKDKISLLSENGTAITTEAPRWSKTVP